MTREATGDHIASYGLRGMTGERIGTRYLYTFDEVREAIALPWFRWRTAKSREAYIAWITAQRHPAARTEGQPS